MKSFCPSGSNGRHPMLRGADLDNHRRTRRPRSAPSPRDMKNPPMLENRFGGTSLPTVGVELELQLVDASTLALRQGVDAIFAELPAELSSSVRREFHTCCVEVATDVCASVDEIRRDLKAKLLWVAGAAAQRGLLLAWGGTHPFSHWKDQEVTSEPRYRALADSFQETFAGSSPLVFMCTWESSPVRRPIRDLRSDARPPASTAGVVSQQPVLVRSSHRSPVPPD